MSINHAQLRAFHAVASHGSFTRAARALHVTQPTLSDHVRALESRYQVRLFERRGKSVTLTGMGEALLDITRRQFSLEADAERLLAAARGMLGGALRVAADSPYLILPLLGGFHRRYPQVVLSLQFGNSQQVLAALRSQHSDICVLPEPEDHDDLHRVAIRRDRLVLIVPQGHAWSTRRTLRLEELASERIVVREPGSATRALFERCLQDRGFSPAEMLEIGSREGVREAVVAGLGVGVIAESEIGADPRLHPLRLRDAALRVTEYAVCQREALQRPVVHTFLGFLDAELNHEPDA